MAQFSTPETTSLEKSIDLDGQELVMTSPEDIAYVYSLEECVDWIESRSFKKVCLQFPDYMLVDASKVAHQFEKCLNQTVYILADTSYGSCCIDFVTASHIKADAIVHFGRRCPAVNVGSVPHLSVHPKRQIDFTHLRQCLQQSVVCSDNTKISSCLLIVDCEYFHYDPLQLIEQLKTTCCVPLDVRRITDDNLKLTITKNVVVIYMGSNERNLLNLYLKCDPDHQWLFHYDDSALTISTSCARLAAAIRKRQRYLVERIRDSRTVGIVLATLAVDSWQPLVARLKALLTAHSKRYYVMSVGRPSAVKLANFGAAHLDVCCVIACECHSIYYETSSAQYLQLIVTPYDVEAALNPSECLHFTYDFTTLLRRPIVVSAVDEDAADISLITGRIRDSVQQMAESEAGTSVAVKGERALIDAGHSTSTWWGLQPQLGQTAVPQVEEGRTGVAGGYANEFLH